MKKLGVLALLVLAIIALPACKRSEVQNVGGALGDWKSPAKQAEKPKEMEVDVYVDSDFSKDLGITVTSLPSAEIMTANKFFVIENWFGQIEFTTADNLSLNVRVAKNEGRPVKGTYSESHVHNKQVQTIGGIEVITGESTDGCTLSHWVKEDMQFSLHSNTKQGLPPQKLLEEVVLGMAAQATDESAASAKS